MEMGIGESAMRKILDLPAKRARGESCEGPVYLQQAGYLLGAKLVYCRATCNLESVDFIEPGIFLTSSNDNNSNKK